MHLARAAPASCCERADRRRALRIAAPACASVRRRRAGAQLLAPRRAASAEAVVARLLAVQAQDLRGARLALRARSKGLTAADVDRALTDDRSLVVAWLGRGTLHLVHREDHPWLLTLTAPTREAASRRRLRQEGVSAEAARRAVSVIERALADEGPLTRPELAERLAAKRIWTVGQATPHLLMLAVLRGVAVLGPTRGAKQAFVLARDWLGEGDSPRVDRDAALVELARRYLAGHGPASSGDLASWIGLPLRDARAGLDAIADELVELDRGLLDLARRDRTPRRVTARLLPAFDPYLLGWRDRSFAVPPEHARRIHPGGGLVRATATVDGLAVGTWTARRSGGRLAIEIDAFTPLAATASAALESEAADVARFEGVER